MPYRRPSVERYAEILSQEAAEHTAVVFLCGPSLSGAESPAKKLRAALQSALDSSGFEVVLGEDDGLEDLQARYGEYAHLNELKFVLQEANAVVLIADSPGSFCELGMFADRLLTESSSMYRDFVLIANERFKNDKSYFNLGPAKAVDDFWKVFFTDFTTFDPTELIERLRRRRAAVRSTRPGRKKSELGDKV